MDVKKVMDRQSGDLLISLICTSEYERDVMFELKAGPVNIKCDFVHCCGVHVLVLRVPKRLQLNTSTERKLNP